MKTNMLLALAAVALIGCGDNKSVPDARVPADAPPDAYCSDCPAAPTLGAQIDRMGRPAVNTVLNRGFDAPQVGAADKDMYNENSDPATWASYIPEFMTNLAMIDVLDSGVCGNGICELGETGTNAGNCEADCGNTATGTGNGCGNQALYAPDPNDGMPTATSYGPLATLLSNDVFFLDTSKAACQFYLAVEFGVVTGGGNSTCGGRAPQYDVIDYSFSMLAMGLKGFDTSLQPLVKDNAPAHTDYLTDFPYLGEPHTP